MVLAGAQIVRRGLLDGQRLEVLRLAGVLPLEESAELRINVVSDLFHSPAVLHFDAVTDAELPALYGAKDAVELLLLFVPCMSVIIENAGVRFAANHDLKGSLRVVHLTLNLELGPFLGPLIDVAARLSQLFGVGFERKFRSYTCPLTAANRGLERSLRLSRMVSRHKACSIVYEDLRVWLAMRGALWQVLAHAFSQQILTLL